MMNHGPVTSRTTRPFVFLAAVPYEFPLSGRTRRLAEALAAAGHPVTFVEMPSLRATARRFAPRAPATARDGVRVVRLRPVPGFLRLHDSAVGRRWIHYARRQLIRTLPALAEAVVVASTPWWMPVLRELPRGVLCYDYIDHVGVHAPQRHRRLFERWDDELLEASDVVTAVSEQLCADLGPRAGGHRVVLIHNGVPRHWIDGGAPEATPRRRITDDPATRVAGFLGAVYEWVDVALLAEAARRLPEVVFAVVGPRRRGVAVDRLKTLPNVRSFPAQPYDAVPAWIQAFDVGLIPFQRGPASASADPVKLYEYLALGKPVVSTLAFGAADAPVAVAATPDAFAEAVRRAADTPAVGRAERIAFARRHTWERSAALLADAVARPSPAAPPPSKRTTPGA